MDDAELAALRARHSQWTITVDDGGYLMAARGGKIITRSSAGRLERAIADHEASQP